MALHKCIVFCVFSVPISCTCFADDFCDIHSGTVIEKELGQLPLDPTEVGASGPGRTILVSPDGQHFASTGMHGRITGGTVMSNMHAVVVVDGVAGQPFDMVLKNSVSFSSDSKRVAYAVESEDSQFVVVDGKVGEGWDNVVYGPIFSPDSSHVVYVAKKGSITSVILDEKVQGQYEDVLTVPIFSSCGRLAYVVKEGTKSAVLQDGNKGELHDYIGTLVFDESGKNLAYPVQDGSEWRMMVNGKAGAVYNGMSKPVFAAKGQSMAYAAVDQAGKYFIVENEKPFGPYDGMLEGSPLYSTDGQHLAYAVAKENRYKVVLDGNNGLDYDAVKGPFFNSNGSVCAYAAKTNGKWVLVINDKSSRQYTKISGPVIIGPDNRVAFLAYDDSGKTMVILEDKIVGTYEQTGLPFFSSDGKHLAFAAVSGTKQMAVVDGTIGPETNGIGARAPEICWIAFSKDGNAFAYCARVGDKMRVFVNHKPIGEFDNVLDSRINISTEGGFDFLVRKIDKIIQVKYTLTQAAQ